MSNGYVEITTRALDRDINNMVESLSILKNELKGMYDGVSELDTMWKGNANQAFQSQFNQDCSTFMELLEVLDNYVESLKQASREYVNCENSVDEVIHSIRI